MNEDEKKIHEEYHRLKKAWDAKYERPSKLLDVHSKYECMNRITEFFSFIQNNVDEVSRVALLATSDPVGLCYLFKKYYGSQIIIICDHPLLERIGEYFENKFDARVYAVNPMFESVHDLVKDCDLVVFPEYEFFAPLDLIKPYGEKLTAALHYVVWPCPGNSTFKVESVSDLLDNLNFKTVLANGEYTNVDDKKGYFALGSR